MSRDEAGRTVPRSRTAQGAIHPCFELGAEGHGVCRELKQYITLTIMLELRSVHQ